MIIIIVTTIHDNVIIINDACIVSITRTQRLSSAHCRQFFTRIHMQRTQVSEDWTLHLKVRRVLRFKIAEAGVSRNKVAFVNNAGAATLLEAAGALLGGKNWSVACGGHHHQHFGGVAAFLSEGSAGRK